MLGHKLVERLSERFETFSTIRTSFASVERYRFLRRDRTIDGVNVEDPSDLVRAFERVRPDVVINAAGVVKQHPSSRDVITALTVNSIVPHRLYQLSFEFGFRLILISTDCVFLGNKGNYFEEDPADALDLYGRSKNLGEISGEKCLTLRTSIIGRELAASRGMVEWFISNRGGNVKGYTRAIFSGFPTIVFADIISDLLFAHPELHGVYHVSSEPIDKYSLLSLLNEACGTGIDITPDDSLLIDRSLNSTRFRQATGFQPATWKEMVNLMASDPMPYDDLRK